MKWGYFKTVKSKLTFSIPGGLFITWAPVINQQADAQSLLFKLREKLKTSCCFHLSVLGTMEGQWHTWLWTQHYIYWQISWVGPASKGKEALKSPVQSPQSLGRKNKKTKQQTRSSAGEGFSALSHHSLFSLASPPLLTGTTSHCSSGISTRVTSSSTRSQQTN